MDDLFTVADTTVQKTIEYNIKHFFPYVNIVSEEDDENTKGIQPTLLPDQIHTDLFTEDVLRWQFRKRKEQLKRYIDQENGLGSLVEDEALNFYQEDMKIWLDPLDGTKSFSTGQTEYCTTLIGKLLGLDQESIFRCLHQWPSSYRINSQAVFLSK